MARAGRRLPIGAEWTGEGTHFRVWAPRRRRVRVVFEGGPSQGTEVALEAEKDGYFAGTAAAAGAGTLYRFRLDDEPTLYPDPASRFQPQGVHGPSQVIDPTAFPWTDQGWQGRPLRGAVLYELHIGTFTPEGTWEAASRELPELARLGVNVVEVMPVAEFAGAFGWGYDGVDLFAPTRLYGTPDDFRRFVDRAHAVGIGVLLDVVYNHLGPDGNYLSQFSQHYLTDRKHEWGDALNFDGPDSGPVREFYLSNASYWIDEFHVDGLRLDATHAMHDTSREHILSAIGRRVRAAARGRATIVVAEHEPQEAHFVRPLEQGGLGLDGSWNDDFHHAAVVALTGRNEAYYADFRGTPQELVSAARHGFLFQGQHHMYQKKPRGTPALDIAPPAFINYLENHDQVGNTARGLRLHQLTSPGRLRAATALFLLTPQTPMLFMGQEFASSKPFLFFADHNPELARLVRSGRADFLKVFPSTADPAMLQQLDPPDDRQTFERCKLDLGERQRHAHVYALHHDLLQLRREDPVFAAQERGKLDGAVLGPEVFVLRFFGVQGDDRLLLVNLGRDLGLAKAAEPLLAPSEKRTWQLLWSSEDPRYGGCGTPQVGSDKGWHFPGHAALVLAAR